jgi:hypothetical protein
MPSDDLERGCQSVHDSLARCLVAGLGIDREIGQHIEVSSVGRQDSRRDHC